MCNLGMAKESRVAIRLSPNEALRFERLSEATGVPTATLARRCLRAAADYYDKHGNLPMPPVILPANAPEYLEATGQYSDDPENPHGTRRDRKSA